MGAFRTRLLTVVGSVVGASSLTACGGKGAVQHGYEESLCSAGEVQYVKDLNPQQPAEYVALHRSDAAAQWGGGGAELIQQSGSCLDSLACPSEAGGRTYEEVGSDFYLVAEQASGVEFFDSKAEVRAFLGTIDTPDEAALLALLEGYDLDCERKNLTQEDDGYTIYAETGQTCGSDIQGHRLFVSEDGTVVVEESAIAERGDPGCAIGRIPGGLQADNQPDSVCHPVGVYFEKVSRLEAAAVAAFEDLVAELKHHGAPLPLIARAELAVRQERRHTILTGALARRFGGKRKIPVVQRQKPRSLLEMARGNAAEGLTRETFGALIGQFQAKTATDPVVRQVMQVIADDETGHAEFSRELHYWLSERLSKSERAQVRAHRQAMTDHFRAEAHLQVPPEVRQLAGFPSVEQSRRLFDGLFAPS